MKKDYTGLLDHVDNTQKTFTVLHIRAENVKKQEDGTFSIVIESEPLTEEQQSMMLELFPNVVDRAYHLLNVEALLASIVHDHN